MKALLPNLITLVNLLCGTLAIMCSFGGYMVNVPYLVLLGFIADFFDGFVARWLNVASDMGKELDSLADMVSFGVLPGIIMYHLLNFACYGSWMLPFNLYHAGAALCIAGFSAMRLAKFNIDTRESDSFFGIPTPTSAAFVVAILMVALFSDGRYNTYLFDPAVLWSLTLLVSVMMVIDYPMISNKVKGLSWAENKWKYLLLASMVPLLFFFDYYGLVLYYFAYIAFSILQKISK